MSANLESSAAGVQPPETWVEVERGEILQPGVHVRMNMQTGKNERRVDDPSLAQAGTDRRAKLTAEALALAKQGIPVFPIKLVKQPNGKIDKEPTCEGGFYAASTDPQTIKRLFAHPQATHIGVPTGEASGISALDFDPRNGSQSFFKEHWRDLTATQTHKTQSGGTHMLYKWVPGLRCSTERIAPGVDIKSEGGYIVWWPASGYEAFNVGMIADMPKFLRLRIKQAQSILHDSAAPPQQPEELAQPYPMAAVELVKATPNPAEATRRDYEEFMLAVQGTIRGSQATGRMDDDEADQLKDAAADWAARWDDTHASDFETERRKWDDDWSKRTRDLSGWPQLKRIARRLGLDTSPWDQSDAEFPVASPEPEPTASTASSEAVTFSPELLALDDADAWERLDLPPATKLLGDFICSSQDLI